MTITSRKYLFHKIKLCSLLIHMIFILFLVRKKRSPRNHKKGEIQFSPMAWPCLHSKSCPLLPLQFDSPDRLKEHLLGVLNVTCRCVAGSVLPRHLLPLCPDLRLSGCYFQGLGSILKDSLSPKIESMGADCV